MFSKKLTWSLVTIYAIVTFLSTLAIIVLQLDARANRQAIREQQNFMVCVLQIQPADRDDATIEKCRGETLAK